MKNKILVEIGSKSMSELTAENILKIVLIEGCCPSTEYWNEPELLDFDNKMFSDTAVIEFVSYRKDDNKRSSEFTFFFNFEKFRFHYVKENEREDKNRQYNGQRVQLPTIRYLIEQGFNVPIY